MTEQIAQHLEVVDELREDKPLSSLANLQGRPVLYIYGEMNNALVNYVRNAETQLSEFDQLTVLLDSPGGDIEDAYRIVLSLRDVMDEIEVFVPRFAKSAATFFCLAADRIYMGRHGELGPLDPQRLNLQGSAKPISALESFKALDQLLKYSLDGLDGIVDHLLTRAPLDIPYAIEHAQPLLAAIVSPLYSKVDLHELSEAARGLAISEDYAVRVMKRWGYRDLELANIERIVQQLVWDYPTHGFVIDLREAQEIGLRVERMDGRNEEMCEKVLETVHVTDIEYPKSDGSHADAEQ